MLSPLGACWLALAILSIVLLRRRPTRLQGFILLLVAALLTAFGGTPLSAWLVSTLEKRHFDHPLPTAESVQALVVLGGGFSASSLEPAGFKTSSAFNRLTGALALLDRGVTTNLVLGGGEAPSTPGELSAGAAIKPWLEKRVDPRIRIWMLENSRTTREEAVDFARLAAAQGWRRIALVTSASHLPRSVAAFRHEGIEVEPVATDFAGLARLHSRNRWNLIPNPENLDLANIWIHEILGLLYYRLKGWT
ncbi:MAG: YdcF family protein [Verrucomicrobiae bacterium]|nr:YdcF family protein [Verrucomicrobiae bacterium]